MFKKILFTILTVFLLNQAKAQPSQYTPMTANGYQMKRVKVDSTLHIPSFCGGQPSLNGSTSPMGALAFDTCFNILYKYNTEFGWTEVGSTDFIDTIFRRKDSVFAKKNGIAIFQYKDSTGGGATPTLQQVLTAGSTLTTNNTITGNRRTIIKSTGTGIKQAFLDIDTNQIQLSNQIAGANSNLTLATNGISISGNTGLFTGDLIANSTNASIRYSRLFPAYTYQFGVDNLGAFFVNGANRYTFPLTAGTTGQILKLSSASQLSWENDSSGGSTIDTTSLSQRIDARVKYTDTSSMLTPYLRKIDTTSLSNRINSKIDSLKRSTDSVFAYKNGQWNFQYKDSIGGSAANDTAKVVIAKVHNATGTTLQRGEVVYLSGSNGDVASVKRANNKQDSTSSKTFGIVRRNIAAGDTGYITTQGQIEKLNLGSFTAGDILWLDSIDGQFTKVVPQAPYHSVFLGVVERANNGNGLMYVKPQNGYELNEIHDVQINNKVNNQILVYSDTQKVWKNRSVYSVVDTTSLSSRIDARVKYTDTASMLTPYLRKADTTVFARKQMPAYSFQANGTNAAANSTAVYFKDTAGTYTGTITWTATTAPSGSTNHSYRWTRVGNLVNLNITLVFSVAGGSVSQVVLTLPSDAPTPVKPAGLTTASNTLYPVNYQFVGNIAANPPNGTQRSIIRSNAANNGFEIVGLNTATTVIACYFTVQYTAQ